MGEIRCYKLPGKGFRAITHYRDPDGSIRRVARVGRTERQARSRVEEACRDRGRRDTPLDITPDTTVREVAQEWFSRIEAAVAAGERSPGTARAYRDRLDNQVLPALGDLRLRQVDVPRVDRMLEATRAQNGVAVAKLTRSVLSGVLELAARLDALPTNPVRDAAPLRAERKVRSSLDLGHVHVLRSRLAADVRARDQDLLDVVDVMLATGLRIGETLALTWSAVDLDARTVEVRATVVRITGHGLVLRPRPTTKAGPRTLELPVWVVEILRRRRAGAAPNGWDAVFTSTTGHLRDPSNTQGDLREAFVRAGYPEITSHSLRRTVVSQPGR